MIVVVAWECARRAASGVVRCLSHLSLPLARAAGLTRLLPTPVTLTLQRRIVQR
jgi:hypothetical protein